MILYMVLMRLYDSHETIRFYKILYDSIIFVGDYMIIYDSHETIRFYKILYDSIIFVGDYMIL